MKWWVEMDSNQRKLTLADLQSAPFSHSGIYPFRLSRGGSMGNPAGPDKENLARARKNFRVRRGITPIQYLVNPLQIGVRNLPIPPSTMS